MRYRIKQLQDEPYSQEEADQGTLCLFTTCRARPLCDLCTRTHSFHEPHQMEAIRALSARTSNPASRCAHAHALPRCIRWSVCYTSIALLCCMRWSVGLFCCGRGRGRGRLRPVSLFGFPANKTSVAVCVPLLQLLASAATYPGPTRCPKKSWTPLQQALLLWRRWKWMRPWMERQTARPYQSELAVSGPMHSRRPSCPHVCTLLPPRSSTYPIVR